MSEHRFTDEERVHLMKASLVDLLAGRGETDVVRASRVANRNQPPLRKDRHAERHPGTGQFVPKTDSDTQQEIASTRDAQQAYADDQMARTDGVSIFRKHGGAPLPGLRRRGQ